MTADQSPTNPQATMSDDARARASLQPRVYFFATLVGIVTIASYLLMYAQTNAWQVAANAAGVALALLLLGLSYLAFRREKPAWVGSLALAAAAVSYLSGELFWTDTTIYNLLGGSLLIVLAGVVFSPGKFLAWLGTVAVYLSGVVLVNWLEPFPRFDISAAPLLQWYYPAVTATLTLGVLWQVWRNLRLDTIRARLVAGFLAVTLIPLGLLAFLDYRNTQATLIENANELLFASASDVAGTVDAFIATNLSAVSSEAALPAFVEFLSLSPQERQGSPARAEASTTLRALSRKDLTDIVSYALLDSTGTNVLDTISVDIGGSEANTEYFRRAFLENATVASQVDFTPEEDRPHTLVFAAPVTTVGGERLGVLRVKYNVAILQKIVRAGNDSAGEGSFGVLFAEVAGRHIHLAHGIAPETLFTTLVPFEDPAQVAQLQAERRLPLTTMMDTLALDLPDLHHNLERVDEQSFFTATDIATGDRLNQVAQVRLESQPTWIVTFFQPRDVFLSAAQAQANLSLLAVIGLGLLAAGAALFVAQVLASPIVQLTAVAQKVAEGDLSARASVETRDEIGILARTFNSMTDQLNDIIRSLEDTVAERTQDLERRATYLEAAAEVGKAATEFTELEDLLDPITRLIAERFGFYHVGIFLLDESRRFAELRAANSEGGWRMLARGHRLRIGEQGIVGYVTAMREPRVEQSVEGEETVHFRNPDLPYTRSEMALPLVAGGELLGALDIQSMEEQAFTEEDVSVLQVLADQVAVAINNAVLIQQVQERMQAERRAYGELTGEAWKELLEGRQALGYRSVEDRVVKVDDPWHPISEQAVQMGTTSRSQDGSESEHLAVPIKVRDVVVGVLETQKPANAGPWTSQETALLEAVGEQLGIALENARLFEQTQRLAQRERMAADVAGQVWSSPNVESILQTAVQELGRALNASQGTIRLRFAEQEGDGNDRQTGAAGTGEEA